MVLTTIVLTHFLKEFTTKNIPFGRMTHIESVLRNRCEDDMYPSGIYVFITLFSLIYIFTQRITPMIYETFLPNGTEYITALIDEAIKNGSRTARVQGKWTINSAVRIPSNFTLILDNCHLRMADGCFSNLFVNEHNDTEVGKTSIGTDHNISIIGFGEAILDGGEYNGLSEKTQLTNGLPPIWKNNLLLFTNVEEFKISGISCRNQRWWALNFIYCSNGYLSNIDFCSNDTAKDENGNIYHGLRKGKYSEILVKNSDGIDLRQGCHDIVIENISGFTEDDTVALTGLDGILEKTFAVNDLPSDICNITIRNVKAAAFCTIVRLLNQGGIKLHDIMIDGVYDMSPDSPHLDKGLFAVRVGDRHLYGARHATKDETYNITIKNVYGRSDYAIALAGDMQEPAMYEIKCNDNCKMLLDQRE